MMRLGVMALGLAAAMVAGCRGPGARPVPYKTLAEDLHRDPETARRQNTEAVGEIEAGDLDATQKTLTEALTADPFFGPAHNNLGAVYLQQKKFYLAAWEFQYAVKLMPYSAEPKTNLGLVYETVGRTDEAEKWYDAALTLEPDNPEIIGDLARTLVRARRTDEKTYRLLQDLVLKETRPDWAQWARDRLALMHPPATRLIGETSPAGPPGKVDAPTAPAPIPIPPPTLSKPTPTDPEAGHE